MVIACVLFGVSPVVVASDVVEGSSVVITCVAVG